MQTNQSIMWLKKKLKSFLMNNVSFYFRQSINTQEYAFITLNKLYMQAAEKYVACCQEFKKFHSRTTLGKIIDTKICQIIYVVIRSFFKYLVCNVKPSVFNREDYHNFFKYSLSFFAMVFIRYKNMFSNVCAIIRSKMDRLDSENQQFFIN